MVEILTFEKGATIIKLNAEVTNSNFWGTVMSYFRRDRKT
jgi:hypothetical protein